VLFERGKPLYTQRTYVGLGLGLVGLGLGLVGLGLGLVGLGLGLGL